MQRVDMFPIMNRRGQWGTRLPPAVCLLTCTCDLQANRIEGEVIGWGKGEESWGIERFTILGNPLTLEPWAELDKIRTRTWETASGKKLGIAITGIDTGGKEAMEGHAFAQSVYSYVRARKQAGRGQSGVIAIKGSSTIGAPLASETMQKNGVNLLFVGTDRAKSTLLERLKLKASGPGYMHFPTTYNEDFFQQLGAEEIRTENGKRQWVKVRNANEALDIRVYSLAVIDLLSPDWRALERIYCVAPEKSEAVAPEAKDIPTDDAKPEAA